MFDDEERDALLARLAAFNDTAVPFARDRALHDVLRERAGAWPDALAVRDDGRALTYAQLWREAETLARWIAALELGTPAIVATLIDDGVDLVVAALGILSAGAVWLPLNPELPRERSGAMLRDAASPLLLTHAARIGAANALHWECPALRHLCCVDRERGVDAIEALPPQAAELWDYIGERAVDAITGGGWLSSFTGAAFSPEEMAEYAANARTKLAPFLTPRSRVLEIGCSTGLTLFELAPLCGAYVGTDLSPVILERTRAAVRARGLQHVRLEALAADRIDELDDGPFDLIVLNSVVQNFPGHNYLRRVLRLARAKLAPEGRLFLGDVMDLDAKDALVAALAAFRAARAGDAAVVTKLDWSTELFLSRRFVDDLVHELDGLIDVVHTAKHGTLRNELTDFRFDSLLRFSAASPPAPRAEPVRRLWGSGDVRAAQAAVLPDRDGDALAYLIYTSGTTGRPKGVAIRHASIHNYVRWAARAYFGAGGGDMALFTSPAFDLTLTSIFVPLYLGRSVRAFGPDDVDRQLARIFGPGGGCDAVKLTPSHITVLGQLGLARSAVRTAIVGGEEFTAAQLATLRALAPEIAVYNEYGPTEATIGCTLARVDAPPIDIGAPIENAAVWILDDRGEPQPMGLAGELCVSGVPLAAGYWNDPELTARRFVPHPFVPGERLYRTGDLARWQDDGRLVLLGRLDHQVKIRGNRVELGEIEAKMRALPGIDDAVVVARSERGETTLVAYVLAPHGLGSLDPRVELARELPPALIPTAFVPLPAFPLTPSGKLDRGRLPAPEPAARPRGEPPRTATERVLAEIWGAVLDVARIDRDDDFFMLGGHSLRAVQVTLRAEARLGVSVPVRELFARPTLKDFAAAVDGAARTLPPALVRVPDAHDYPVSAGQRRMWLLRRIDADPTVYTVCGAWHVDRALDVERLRAAFAALAARHEILRTAIVERDGEPRQRIEAAMAVPFAVEDLRDLPDPDARAERLAGEIAAFDLAVAPLWRVRLLRVADARFVLSLQLHHAISDGWSAEIFWRDLVALYAGESLPPLRVQYRDYAVWQTAVLERADGSRRYWHERLAAPRPLMALPTDAPRPPVASHVGAMHHAVLPRELLAAAKALAARERTSLFALLLAATSAVLQRWSGQREMILGTPVAGRTALAIEEQIGFYVNTLALRLRVDPASAFTTHLGACAQTIGEALEHQAIPFDVLVDELAAERDPSRSPLFDVLVVLQNAERGLVDRAAFGARPLALRHSVARFDLTIFFAEEDGALGVTIEYATSLFAPETAARLAGHLQRALETACLAPATALERLDLAGAAERTELLTAAYPGPEPPALLAQFAAQVARLPEQCAVRDAERALSFAELNRRSDALAAALERAAPAGTIVGVLAERSVDNLVAFLAVLKAGCSYLGLDPAYPDERLALLCARAAVPAVVAQPALAGRAARCAPHVVPVDDAVEAAAPSGRRAADVAYVVFTSGSTGEPKGVLGTARCLAQLVAWQRGEIGDELRSAQYAQLGFDVAVQEMAFAACSGGTLCVVPESGRRDPARLRALLEAERIALLTLPFTALAWLAETPPGLAGLPALRHLVTSGEALHLRPPLRLLLEERRDLVLHNQYGPSETHVVTSHRIAAPLGNLEPQPPIGRPIAGTRCLILDRHGVLVPSGVAGELCIGGRSLALGYLGDAALTARRFVADPYLAGERLYRTGDLARRRADGTIAYLGRLDDQLKIRGHRVEPAEIEAALVRHAAVDAAAVAAQPGGNGSAELVAYLVGTRLPQVEELRAFLAGFLPAYLIPSRFVRLDALPLTASGKCDRAALAAAPGRPLAAPVRGAAPASERERALAALWTTVLGVETVGVDDDFFALGGHSLRALQLVAAVRERFGLELAPLAVFQRPTLRGLAQWLDDLARYGERHGTLRAQSLGTATGRAVFALPPLLGYGIVFHSLAERLSRPLVALDFPADDPVVERLSEVIAAAQERGPITLFGYSAGGNLAFEVAKHLERCGREVDRLVLLDSFRLTRSAPRPRAALESEAQSNLEYFAATLQSDPQSRMFVEHPQIREHMAQRVLRFLAWLDTHENDGAIRAEIALLESAQFAGDPRRPAWRDTSARFTLHPGVGPHTDMLLAAHLDENARRLDGLLSAPRGG